MGEWRNGFGRRCKTRRPLSARPLTLSAARG